ncbi:MAG: hypothetical protein AB7S81_06895, partial [Bdellovibrionales bacterium]
MKKKLTPFSRAVVVIVLAFCLCLPSRPTKATWCDEPVCPGDVVIDAGKASFLAIWEAAQAAWGYIFIAKIELQGLWEQTAASAKTLALEAVTGVKKDSADYVSDSIYQTAQINTVAKIASDNPETPVRNVRLCHNMRAIQVGGTTGSFHHKHAKAL